MSILLSCRNLSKHFGPRPLFERLTFGLFENERTGLIGPNGAGKSTLLKILAGLEHPDAGGDLSIRRGLRVRYLAQSDSFPETRKELTVQGELIRSLQGLQLEDYEIEMRVGAATEEFWPNADQPVKVLSGGYRKRLAILSQVLSEPDLLLLDEPTNHLDLEGVLWLERLLTRRHFSFLVVTHDRKFLESVCNRVIELNKRYTDGHFSSKGNYSDFIEAREAHLDAQKAREESTRNIVRREIEWLRRGPKARTTKQKARIDRAGRLIGDLEDLTIRNAQDKSASLDFSSSERKSKSLIKATQISKSLGGRKLFGPLDLTLGPGDKLGLLGGNGSGKTTLLNLLSGKLKPDSGVLQKADGLKVVSFDQHRDQLDLNMTLRKALCENGEKVPYRGNWIHVIGWAERFLFSKGQLDLPLSRLSGGEQSRVLIARLMLKPADILLLDEPTNDLDLNSLEVLETSMMEFSGALVLVTHDRYLLDRVSREILALDGKGGARFFSDLSQWEDAMDETTVSTDFSQEEILVPDIPTPKRGLSGKESKELKKLESEILAAEKDVKQAELCLSDPSIQSHADELLIRQKALEQAKLNADDLIERWEKLEAKRS